MANNLRFKTLTLDEKGIILHVKNEQKIEISYSNLIHVYIKEYKIKPINELVFILTPFLLFFISIQYRLLENLMFVPLFAVLPIFFKIHNFKSYGIIVSLKDGSFYKRKGLSLQYIKDNIFLVNTINREQSKHFFNTIAFERSETLFCSEIAS